MIRNNEIRSNSGAGIYCIRSASVVINNTIVGNKAINEETEFGISTRVHSHPRVLNTIIWNNSPSAIGGGAGITVTYSDIQGGYSGEGNIADNPCFADPSKDDYHLRPDSPCIRRGISEAAVIYRDIEGKRRRRKPYQEPNMGAYENSNVELYLGLLLKKRPIE